MTETRRRLEAEKAIEHIQVMVRAALQAKGVPDHTWSMSWRPFGVRYLVGSEARIKYLDPTWGDDAVRKHARHIADDIDAARRGDKAPSPPQIDLEDYIKTVPA